MQETSVTAALTLSGRYGFTSRQWGLTMDNIIGATVVLANGSVVEASASRYRDLYWVRPAFLRMSERAELWRPARPFVEQPRLSVSSPTFSFGRFLPQRSQRTSATTGPFPSTNR